MFQLLDRLANWYIGRRMDQFHAELKKQPEYKELELKKFTVDKDGYNADFIHEDIGYLCAEASRMLVRNNAKNYFQFIMFPARLDPEARPVEVTLRWYWGGKTPAQKAAELDAELNEAKAFHPRAMKLIGKKKPFIVIAKDEPYFKDAYAMIRDHERSKGTWTIEDEALFLEKYGIVVE